MSDHTPQSFPSYFSKIAIGAGFIVIVIGLLAAANYRETIAWQMLAGGSVLFLGGVALAFRRGDHHA